MLGGVAHTNIYCIEPTDLKQQTLEVSVVVNRSRYRDKLRTTLWSVRVQHTTQ